MTQTNPLVRHPSRFVPLAAVATKAPDGTADPISPANPIPSSEVPLSNVRALVEDVAVDPGLAILVDCSGQGTLNLEFADGTQLPLTFAPGLTILPFAIRQRISLGSTAVANAWVLD